jgi:hypothetical protein
MTEEQNDADRFRCRMEAAYGSAYGWQRWFARAFDIERRTLTRWIQKEGSTRIPGWAWTALDMIETIKRMTGELPMSQMKVRGRPPQTGRYETRQQMCEAVLRDVLVSGTTHPQAAAAAGVTVAVVQRIVARQEGMTPKLRKDIERAASKRAKEQARAAKKRAA